MENVFTAFAESTDSAGGLRITLPDTDEKGYIPSEEISRRIVKYPSSLCGKYFHVAATDRVTSENIPVYSARLYEEAEYAKIRSAFEEGVRNTYTASFKCITASGKIALYELAQGVVGGIYGKHFSLNRIQSFYDITLPETLPVTILGFDEDKITLSSVAGFLGFRDSIETLGLEAEGTYKIDGDEIKIEIEDNDEDEASWDDLLKAWDGTFDFEKEDDYIKINGVKYEKAD